MFQIDDEEIKMFEADLKRFANRAFPFATRKTINNSAYKAQEIAKEHIRNTMTLRNVFTLQSIQVHPERVELSVRHQMATIGSTVDYMEDQEFGGTKVKKGSEGVPIATSYSAGQQGKQPRTRLPSRSNKLQNISLSKRRKKGSNRKQINLIAVKTAVTSGNRYVFLDLRRGAGIFRVLGSKRRPRIKMLWDLSRKSVVIPKTPWLAPSTIATIPFISGFYREALIYQLKRKGLFRSR